MLDFWDLSLHNPNSKYVTISSGFSASIRLSSEGHNALFEFFGFGTKIPRSSLSHPLSGEVENIVFPISLSSRQLEICGEPSPAQGMNAKIFTFVSPFSPPHPTEPVI